MKIIQDFKVLSNIKISKDYFVLDLLSDKKLPKIQPGQFVQVLIENSKNTFLRRPFSIHDVNYEQNTISLLIKKIGEGTTSLSLIQKGDKLNIIYPLGNNFKVLNNKKVLLIGGGCGIAPLLYLAKKLYLNNNHITTLIGGKCKYDIIETDEFFKISDIKITTEDGFIGEKGFVTEHSVFTNNLDFDFIYSCGPEMMLKSVAKIAKLKNIDCEISLENTMACGFGACLCCVTETKDGNKCVCTDGPVFNINKLKW